MLGVVLLLLAVVATWRQLMPAPILPRLPAATAESWMADCLPGIGPVKREAATAALRAGRLDALPPATRTVAVQVFTFADQ